MSHRLLLLTAGFGEGHNAAARALCAAAESMHGPGVARVVDVFAAARPRMNAAVRRSYLALINRAPGLWRTAYAWLDRSPRAPRLGGWFGRETRYLEQLIARESPEILCSTYPLYAYLLPRIRGPRPPHFSVVTDSISINSLWWRGECAGWFVPNRDSAAVLLAAGVPASRVHSLGFPVAPFFADQQRRLAPPVPGAWVRPRVLYIINSGTRDAAETARRLLEVEAWDVTCTVGRNERLGAELTALAAKRRGARVLGWTTEIPRLLLTHHVVVSKAGGATTQEAIAARCPMIVNQIVPGQEEGNYELLRRHGVGALARTPEAILATIRAAFAHDAATWRQWRAALERLARPNAAREIIAAMAEDEVSSHSAPLLPLPHTP